MPDTKKEYWYLWPQREMAGSDGETASGVKWNDVPVGSPVQLNPRVQKTGAKKTDEKHLIVSGPGADKVCHGEGEDVKTPDSVDVPVKKLKMTNF